MGEIKIYDRPTGYMIAQGVDAHHEHFCGGRVEISNDYCEHLMTKI